MSHDPAATSRGVRGELGEASVVLVERAARFIGGILRLALMSGPITRRAVATKLG